MAEILSMWSRMLKTKMLYVISGMVTVIGTILISIFSNILTEYIPLSPPHNELEINFKGLNAPYSELVSKRINEAIDTYEEKDHKKALVHLNSILATLDTPRSHTTKKQKSIVYSIIATCYFEMNQYQNAIKYLNQSVNLSPSSYSHKLLSDIYYLLLSKTKSKAKSKKYLKKYKKHMDKAYELKVSRTITTPLNTLNLSINNLERRFYSVASQRVFLALNSNEEVMEEGRVYSKNLKEGGIGKENIVLSSNANFNISYAYSTQSSYNYNLSTTDVPFISTSPKTKAYLISIGINSYSDKNISELNYAEKDSTDIKNSFMKIYGSKLKYYNLTGSNATKNNILSSIYKVRDMANSSDMVYIYYSGHGYLKNKYSIPAIKKRYSSILTVNSTLDNLENTSISIQDIYDIFSLAGKHIKPLIILDSCRELEKKIVSKYPLIKYKNIFNNKKNKNIFTLKNNIERVKNEKMIVIYSSSNGELSAESNKLKNGVFTYYLLEAINKKNREKIKINDIFPIVQKNINKYLNNLGVYQKIDVSVY